MSADLSIWCRKGEACGVCDDERCECECHYEEIAYSRSSTIRARIALLLIRLGIWSPIFFATWLMLGQITSLWPLVAGLAAASSSYLIVPRLQVGVAD